MNGGLEVRVEGARVVRLFTSPPVAAKILPGGAGPVLMLVGSAAGLLEDDSVRLRIDLGPGARLTVRTTAATIAHPCPGGGSTFLEVDCRLAAGAHLTWLPDPIIACAGCRHDGRTRLTLAPGATVTWLDSVTLGRSGEVPGQLDQRLDAERDGRPLLREGLRLGTCSRDGSGGPEGWDGPAVLGPHRHVAALHLLGRRVPPDIGGVMQLAGPGTTARFVASRGDALARQVATVLPLFLHAADTVEPAEPVATAPAKEAIGPPDGSGPPTADQAAPVDPGRRSAWSKSR